MLQEYNLPKLVLYASETRSLAVWQGRKLRVFGNEVLSKVLGH